MFFKSRIVAIPKSVDVFLAGVSDGCLEIEVYPKPED